MNCLRDHDIKKEIACKRGIKESDIEKDKDGIISDLNRYLGKVKEIQEKKYFKRKFASA